MTLSAEEKLKLIEDKIDVDVLLGNEYFTMKNGEIVVEDTEEPLMRNLEVNYEEVEMAISETAPDWKTRCYSICSALGIDIGDPDWIMPDEQKKFEELKIRHKAAEDTLFAIDTIAYDAFKSFLKVSSSGGMPQENIDHILNNFQHMINLKYLEFGVASYYHERISDRNGSKEIN